MKTSRVQIQSSAKKGFWYREVPGKKGKGCREELGVFGGCVCVGGDISKL